MSIVQPRVGRVCVTNAHTSVQLAVFDYSFKPGISLAVEAAVYEDVMSFVWGSIPSMLPDGTIFGFHIEEALHADDEFIPLYSREPLTALQLVQTVLKIRGKMIRAGAQAVAPAHVATGAERVLAQLFATPWRAPA